MREILDKEGRIKQVSFRRIMSEDEVRVLITNLFEKINLISFAYLRCQGNTLSLCENQSLNGNDIINLIGSGCLYIQEIHLTENAGLEPISESVLDTFNSLPTDVSSNSVINSPDIPLNSPPSSPFTPPSPVSPIVYPTYHTPIPSNVTISYSPIMISSDDFSEEDVSNQLDNIRQLRREQDIEFERSLMNDRSKEEMRRKAIEWSEKVEQVTKLSLRPKFAISGTLRVAFKVPDGYKLHHTFTQTSTVRDMYQFVLLHVKPPFSLLTNSLISVSIMNSDNIDIEEFIRMLTDTNENVKEEVNDMKRMEVFLNEEKDKRRVLLESLACTEGSFHQINRETVYADVIKLYADGCILNENPIHISEIALDQGSNLLIPMIHPQMDMSVLPTIGRIISHGYLVAGILPVKIALPTLMIILLGSLVTVTNDVLLDTLFDYVTYSEKEIFQQALSMTSFPPDFQEKLINILSLYGCRKIPKPTEVKVFQEIAQYEFIYKPSVVINKIHSGIPESHHKFWKSPAQVKAIYENLNVNRDKILSILLFPEVMTVAEERISNFLCTMIGNMSNNELCLLVRFITGYGVCTTHKIKITFNGLCGLARRPIAHTCSSHMELPTDYLNYQDFANDFQTIFNNINQTFMMNSL